MILKKILTYLQIFTLTASLMNKNIGTKDTSQKERPELKYSNNDQYRAGDIENLVIINSKSQDTTSLKHDRIPSSQSYNPKTPSAQVGPAWVRNINKYYKERSLGEKYRRTERTIYRSEPPDPLGTKDFKQQSSILHGIEKYDDKHLTNNRSEVNKGKQVLCFLEDDKNLMSLVVPCHFMSRLFYFMLVPQQRNVRIFKTRGTMAPILKFSFGSTDESPGSDGRHLDETIDKTEECPTPKTKQDTKFVVNGGGIPPHKHDDDMVPPRKHDDDIPPHKHDDDIPPRKHDDDIPPQKHDDVIPPQKHDDVIPPQKHDDDISAPKKDSEMPSFDEWKIQQEEGKTKDQNEQNSFGSPVKSKVPKKEINYASVTCGAKVVQANPEAQNPSYILYENKDQYMINPCSAKKGFTVELCESIQVQAVDLGNMEFFSSLPHVFDVHISQRFPVKEWIYIGTFQAKNERTIQSFPVQRSLTYAKYVRVDIVSHFGNEHFCPLSILRVFGVSLDEDEEVEISQDEVDYSDIIDVSNPMDDKDPNNLFTKATDTVISIMKTVLPSSSPQPLLNNHTQALNESINITFTEKRFDSTKLDHETSSQDRFLNRCVVESRRNYDDTLCKYYRLLSGKSLKFVCSSEDEPSRNDFVRDEIQPSDNIDSTPEDDKEDLNLLLKTSSTDKLEVVNGDDVQSLENKKNAKLSEHLVDKTDNPLECNETKQENHEDAQRLSNESSKSLDLDNSKNLKSNISGVVSSNRSDGFNDSGEANPKKDVSNDGTSASPKLEPLKDYELDVSNIDDITYQKLSSKGKESIFTKLKSRIKNLETNLNLTNRYLEELSQRYKKQTEEMYTSLNKTISKLIITAKSAEERDLKQQDRIQSLEIRFSNLTTVFTSLYRSLQDVHSHVLERHLLMMAVEFALFFALLTYCQGNRRQPSHSRRCSAPVLHGKVSDLLPSNNGGDGGTGLDEKNELSVFSSDLCEDSSCKQMPLKSPTLSKANISKTDSENDDCNSRVVSSNPAEDEIQDTKMGSDCPECIAVPEVGSVAKVTSPTQQTCTVTTDSDNNFFIDRGISTQQNRKNVPRLRSSDFKFRDGTQNQSTGTSSNETFKNYDSNNLSNLTSHDASPSKRLTSNEISLNRNKLKKRKHCFPFKKGLKWTKNLSEYFDSRSVKELSCQYFSGESVVVRVGLKRLIPLRTS